MNKRSKQLEAFPLTISLDVQWGEMDAAQHVNNVTYMRYAETARIRLMDQFDFGWSENSAAGVILAWQDCKYIFPVTYPDSLTIGVKVSEIKADRFFIQCHMFSHKHDRLVAITNHSHVPYNYETLSKIDLPAEWLTELKKWQA